MGVYVSQAAFLPYASSAHVLVSPLEVNVRRFRLDWVLTDFPPTLSSDALR